MKRVEPTASRARFRGTVRHYHRSGAEEHSSWEEWVDGNVPRRDSRAFRWLGFVVAVLVFVAVAYALILSL
jgi:hypothetical protein